MLGHFFILADGRIGYRLLTLLFLGVTEVASAEVNDLVRLPPKTIILGCGGGRCNR